MNPCDNILSRLENDYTNYSQSLHLRQNSLFILAEYRVMNFFYKVLPPLHRKLCIGCMLHQAYQDDPKDFKNILSLHMSLQIISVSNNNFFQPNAPISAQRRKYAATIEKRSTNMRTHQHYLINISISFLPTQEHKALSKIKGLAALECLKRTTTVNLLNLGHIFHFMPPPPL